MGAGESPAPTHFVILPVFRLTMKSPQPRSPCRAYSARTEEIHRREAEIEGAVRTCGRVSRFCEGVVGLTPFSSFDDKPLASRLAELLLLLTAILLETACGSPGVPMPPSLELAQPVTDLRATRKGDKVTLTWTAPVHTTERRNMDQGGTIQICRSLAAMRHCDGPAGHIQFNRPGNKGGATQHENYQDRLPPASPQPSADYFYAVNVQNSYGKSAGLSNQVEVPAAPTLAAPDQLEAKLTADGVDLSWAPTPVPGSVSSLRFVYRIYRRESGATQDSIAGEVPVSSGPPGLIDRGFQWEKTYDYRATVVTVVARTNGAEQQVEGDDSVSVRVIAHDIFPPATPTGLQAVFSRPGQKPFIDLVWVPNNEADLAGYNVYRSEAGSQPKKINQEPLKAPAYRDTQVSLGHQYTYSVSAIDVRGNESPHSEEASESVPPP